MTDAEQEQDLETPVTDELEYWAWTIIANVGHERGGWDAQDPVWVAAATKWRDAFHAKLDRERQGDL